MIFFSVFIILSYSVLILKLYIGFDKVPKFEKQKTDENSNFSILIPFRNEEKDLPLLLKSIKKLKYPKKYFEIILINDESTDKSIEIIEDFKNENPKLNLNLINSKRKSNSPKKDAIETAISKANFKWIITTDADCQIPQKWLQNFNVFINNNKVKMIVAPVTYSFSDNFFNNFQNLDFLSLQGTTIGSFGMQKPFMCNGANLCYSKNAFIEIDGFKGNNHIASGDDVFLLEKMNLHFKNEVKYLKSTDSIVKTKPQPNLSQLLNQRVRWAAKAGSTQNSFGKLISIIVFTTNLYLIILLVLAFLSRVSWQYFGLIFLIKLNIDFLLLYKAATFLKHQNSMKIYLYSSFIYPFFTVYVAIASFFKGYTWKGRRFKK